MIVNDPATVAEVRAEFLRYEQALITNDVAALDGFFWADERAIRYGGAENLYGFAAIQAFRAGRPAVDLARGLERTEITTFGKDYATASTLFRRENSPEKIGRQMQTWTRFPEGWRIVAAHVSVIQDSNSA